MQLSTSSSGLAFIQEEPKLLGVRMNFGCSACWIRMPIGGIAQCSVWGPLEHAEKTPAPQIPRPALARISKQQHTNTATCNKTQQLHQWAKPD